MRPINKYQDVYLKFLQSWIKYNATDCKTDCIHRNLAAKLPVYRSCIFYLKFNFSFFVVKLLKSKTTRKKYVTKEEKKLCGNITGECMTNEGTYSVSEENNQNKIKYFKLDCQSADLEEVIERINSRQNIKTTYKNISRRHS